MSYKWNFLLFSVGERDAMGILCFRYAIVLVLIFPSVGYDKFWI
jgi:hypothetical protein